jgi:hypothetical protein
MYTTQSLHSQFYKRGDFGNNPERVAAIGLQAQGYESYDKWMMA